MGTSAKHWHTRLRDDAKHVKAHVHLSGFVAWAALAISAATGLSSWQNARDQSFSQARAEITSYVDQMAKLDAEGTTKNGQRIAALSRLVRTLVESYGQDHLRLNSSIYHLIALYTALATSDLENATWMAKMDLRTSLASRDSLLQIQAYRILADIAAQEMEMKAANDLYQKALAVHSPRLGHYSVQDDAQRFTRVYQALSAMMIVDKQSRKGIRKECQIATKLATQAKNDLDQLSGTWEVTRRALRIFSNPCKIPFVNIDKLHSTYYANYGNNP